MKYNCKCKQNCLDKNQILCTLNKNTRNNCKHCRYTKCVSSAGMVSQWVLEQYIPKVGKPATNEGNQADDIINADKTPELINTNSSNSVVSRSNYQTSHFALIHFYF